MRILLVDDRSAEQGADWAREAKQLADGLGWHVEAVGSYRSGFQCVRQTPFDVVLLARPPRDCHDALSEFRKLWGAVQTGRATTLLISSSDDPCEFAGDSHAVVDVIPYAASVAELRGRFAMIERYHRHVSHLVGEVERMERLGKRLNEHFREVDQEMQLASRLQRDFLPVTENPINRLQFDAVYRPATWVSGDIYDIFRIDEQHTGVYVADAVGHGVAASLLTMFIKRSFMAKELRQDGYRVIPPAETLSMLNRSLAEQQLPNCQFVTASYCVFDHENRRLTFARGGHPYPLLMRAGGNVEELKSSGGLLGLFPDETFQEASVSLEPGDKVMLYTDGVELAFQSGRQDMPDTTAYVERFKEVARLPVRAMLSTLRQDLDRERGSLNPHDDVTLVAFEFMED